MINEKMYELGSKRSIIREIFEYGKMRKAMVGEDKVYDFSLGNPNVLPPKEVNETILNLLGKDIHSYTSAQGDMGVRKAIADELNERFSTDFKADNLYLTCGAAGALCSALRAVLNQGEEVITFAPFFTEYRVFVESQGGKLVVVPPNMETFQIQFEEFAKLIRPETKAVIINSPNNPSGVVYSEETVLRLSHLLREKEKEYHHSIYLITDEPYREIIYNGKTIPFVTKYYDDTIVCYSYSKSISLPGERIGYVLVPDEVNEAKMVYAAVVGAGRALGYVCAPSLFQYVIKECCGKTSDMRFYEKNKALIYDGLMALGYECVKPEGAFYLFVKALEEDAKAFAKKALEYDLLLVPSDDFGVKGYVRIAYCVRSETIINSMKAFAELKKAYEK